MKMYALYDSAAECYSRPIFARQHGEVLRNFEAQLSDPENVICQSPEHFSLWYLADFDDDSGVLRVESPMVCLAKAWELKDG